jgi:uracil-DNA glycosylase
MIASLPADWRVPVEKAYRALDPLYRDFLAHDTTYFPNKENYLNAFRTLPRSRVHYILFGQDPYPRRESAGGYAFIDTRVEKIFSPTGLSKEVNRATSLRNFIKMALVARGDLDLEDTSQEAIASIDKTPLIQTIDQLRCNFERAGVLLLNTALVFTQKQESTRHIKAWRPFVASLLESLQEEDVTLILFGSHAKALQRDFDLSGFDTVALEHPYNHSFVTSSQAQALFAPMKLLEK